ncbi:MAG: hypothetical protein ACI9QC_000234 [Oceanicoccus sp.]|jgi:hypothetical protein
MDKNTTQQSKTELMKALSEITVRIAKEGNTDAIEDELDRLEDAIGLLKKSGKLSDNEMKELEDALDAVS